VAIDKAKAINSILREIINTLLTIKNVENLRVNKKCLKHDLGKKFF
jgi:hypothetical protein